MVDFSNFKHAPGHYIEAVSLYNNDQELLDTIYFKEEENNNSMVIFNLEKINEKESLVKREDEDFMPRHWDINSEFHAVIQCNIHGNWSDVMEDFL